MQYSERDEKGYPWLFFQPNQQWKLTVGVSALILVASIGFFVWGSHVSDDMGGDSFTGLVFAVGSTVFMLMAAISFSLRRRARKRVVGELNKVLNWHVCFGVISLVMVFLHSFGNYNPRTGTYALYGMIALAISGFVGRALDRIMPRLIAQNARKALTAQGEDRIESISRKLQAITSNDEQEQRDLQPVQSRAAANPASFSNGPAGWDMAYITLDAKQQKMRDSSQYPMAPSRSAPRRGGTLSLNAREHISEIEEVQLIFKQETYFRYIIRIWRLFHISLAVLTIGLTLWHIEYALSLIMPAIQKFGFGYLLPWP